MTAGDYATAANPTYPQIAIPPDPPDRSCDLSGSLGGEALRYAWLHATPPRRASHSGVPFRRRSGVPIACRLTPEPFRMPEFGGRFCTIFPYLPIRAGKLAPRQKTYTPRVRAENWRSEGRRIMSRRTSAGLGSIVVDRVSSGIFGILLGGGHPSGKTST
jgi:hypothetical protein